MNDFDTDYTDDLVCPHCGHVERDAWELQEDSGGAMCMSCGEDFHYERHVTVRYSSEKR